MNLRFLKKADNYTFNKANIVPILDATIGTFATVVAIIAMSTPTLFGSLSEGSLESLGFTPAVLGLTALTSKFIAVVSIQQIFTNRAIENASKGAHESMVLGYITGEEACPNSALQGGISVVSSQAELVDMNSR